MSDLNVTPDDIRKVLKERVYDPEIGINIVDLGLVYNIEVLPDEKKALINMTPVRAALWGRRS